MHVVCHVVNYYSQQQTLTSYTVAVTLGQILLTPLNFSDFSELVTNHFGHKLLTKFMSYQNLFQSVITYHIPVYKAASKPKA